jgi:diguanylate cyclase
VAAGHAAFLAALLAANSLLWSPIGYWLAKRAKQPLDAERRNLLFDSAMGGVWIALMHFQLVPSAVLIVTLAMDKLAFGGWRFLLLTITAQAFVALATAWLTGSPLHPEASLLTIAFCLPHLFAYPLMVSASAYRLLRTVTRQHQQLSNLTRIDRLTGLLNRSSWMEAADTCSIAINAAQRRRRSCLSTSIASRPSTISTVIWPATTSWSRSAT